MLRAADDSTDAAADSRRRAFARGFASMAAERLVGTAVVFAAAGTVLLTLAPLAAAGCLVAALIAGGIAARWMRALSAVEVIQVVALSVLGWLCFASIFMLSTAILEPTVPASVLPSSAAVALAGMSVPVGVGRWGLREAASAWSFSISGLPAADGIRVSVGYGVLAVVSTVPGPECSS
ncbi:hypothetical protein [Nesterenkonia pannonica]|uniref:hypothetical protein n=1 Tax=Nesterenkonia pannonica TaxID=1548602 RepID=UPI002164E5C2|nr:hypothetical protein [Nesterenkonia pannonica]